MSARVFALVIGCALALGAGCATTPPTAVVNGQTVPRLSQEYVGQYYGVRHSLAHPNPGGPSGGLNDAGGKISGQVCGMDIDYDVTHRGDHVQLVGILDGGRFNSQIQVRDVDGVRRITGNVGSSAVDLHLLSGALVGTSGYRQYRVQQVGDRMIGKMRAVNTDFLSDVTINGRDALWQMTPAAQGAVVPSLLTCFIAKIGMFGRSPLTVGFGGQAGAQPRDSSSLYQP